MNIATCFLIEMNEHTQFEWLKNTESKSQNIWNSTNQHIKFTLMNSKKRLNIILNASKNLQKKNIKPTACLDTFKSFYQNKLTACRKRKRKLSEFLNVLHILNLAWMRDVAYSRHQSKQNDWHSCYTFYFIIKRKWKFKKSKLIRWFLMNTTTRNTMRHKSIVLRIQSKSSDSYSHLWLIKTTSW